MRREILAALSLANLWYLRLWSELLTYSRADTYLMVHPPLPAAYLAIVANVLLLAAIFLGLRAAAIGMLSKRAYRFAEMAFVASLILPLNSAREVMGKQFPYLKSPLIQLVGVTGVWIIAVALCIAGVIVVIKYSRPVTRGVVAFLVLLSPFCAVTFGQSLWRAAHYDDSAYRSKPPAPLIAGARKFPRIVWFICDEWDFRLTFKDRDRTLDLPQIDRLRNESLYASNAYPPGSGTPESIPSYYMGQLYSPVWFEGTRRLMVQPRGQKEMVVWGEQPNVFQRARELGVNTALLEWFHPTCRVFDGLNLCEWWPLARQHNSLGNSFFEILPRQTRSLFESNLFSPFGRTLSAEQHAGVYHAMLAEARKLVVNQDYGFSVIHLPIPHNPFVYDRRTGTFTLGNSPIKGYVDHLALLDLTIGDLRRIMERAGLWDNTTVLFTSDHEYREAMSLDGKSDIRIPYLLKMAAQKEGAVYDQPFNAVVTSELLLAVLRGEVTDAPAAKAWLDQHRNNFPIAR